jgi:hypothetical protein
MKDDKEAHILFEIGVVLGEIGLCKRKFLLSVYSFSNFKTSNIEILCYRKFKRERERSRARIIIASFVPSLVMNARDIGGEALLLFYLKG